MAAHAVRIALRRMVVAAIVVGLPLLFVGEVHKAVAQSPFKTVRIGDASYVSGDALAIARRLPTNGSIKFVLSAIKACRGVGAYGFVSTQRAAGGVVAWLPRSFSTCFVSGGGPTSAACFKTFKTPADQDPTGVSGGRAGGRHYVLIAGTNADVCTHLSTQVPGGVWAKLNTAAGGFTRGSTVIVKCQRSTSQGLLDYVAPYATALPASKRAFWIHDYYVATGGDRLAGVPSC